MTCGPKGTSTMFLSVEVIEVDVLAVEVVKVDVLMFIDVPEFYFVWFCQI